MAQEEKNAKKSTPKKVPYVLKKDVVIGGKLHKKGTKYPLTEKGAKYFKSQYFI